MILLNSLFLAVLGLYVLTKGLKKRTNRLYFLFNTLLAFSFFTIFMVAFGHVPEEMVGHLIVAGYFTNMFAAIIVWHFSLVFSHRVKEKRFFLRAGYVLVGFFSAVLLFFPGLLISDVISTAGLEYWPLMAPIGFWQMGMNLVFLFLGLYELLRFFLKSEGYNRNRAKYILFGVLFLGLGTANVIPISMGFEVPPYGFFFVQLYAVMIAYALVKYRLMDINVLARKTLFYSIVFVPVLAFYMGSIYFFQRSGAGFLSSHIMGAFLLGVLFLFTPILEKINKSADNFIFKERFFNQQVFNFSIRSFVAILDSESLIEHVLNILTSALDAKSVVIFLRTEEDQLKVRVSFGVDERVLEEKRIKSSSPLVKYLQKNKEIIELNELRRKTPKEEFSSMVRDLQGLEAEVLMPLVSRERLQGLVVLGENESGRIYDRFEMEMLENLANITGLSLGRHWFFQMANTDDLTGLANMRHFMMLLKSEVLMVRRGESDVFSVIMADLDHFKDLNDKHGHKTGDEALKQVATVIKETVRSYDVVARYGGEEWVILLRGTHLKQAEKVAEKVRINIEKTSIENPYAKKEEDKTLGITISLGVACFKREDDEDLVVRRADEALYIAKEAGRNCTRTEEDVSLKALE